MKPLNYKTLALLAMGAASSLSAAIVSYSGMDASFATEGAAQSTAVIPLDATYGQFGGVGGLVRYYSGTIALNYDHSNPWTSDGASFVNFHWNANAADSDLVAATIGVGFANDTPKFNFPDAGYTTGTAMPATIDFQIKLTGTGDSGAQYTIDIFTGVAATASTEGTPTFSGGGNFTYYGDYIKAVSFSTSGAGNVGTAASSNFKSSDAWIAPIPEPSTYAALGGLGVLGFAALRRRRA